MKNVYYLQIEVEFSKIHLIDKIMGIKHNTISSSWQYMIVEKEATISYIYLFMDLLEGKYKDLLEIGISRNMITIWRMYSYDTQCNFEYSPLELKRLGDSGIVLNIVCWDTGEEPKMIENILN